jgi:hypothetical protein
MKIIKSVLLIFIFVNLFNLNGFANFNDDNIIKKGFTVSYYRDVSNNATIKDVKDQKFTFPKSENEVLNFGIDNATYWIKLISQNRHELTNQVLYIDQARLSYAELFIIKNNSASKLSLFNPFSYSKSRFTQGKIFKLPTIIEKGSTIYIKVHSNENLILPISIIKEETLLEKISFRGIIFGFYTGIMSIMFIYNLFLYIIIKDKSYIYYVFYILCAWLTQISIQGYSSKYFWTINSKMDEYSTTLFSITAVLFASLFTLTFLNTKHFSKTFEKLIKIFAVLTILNLFILFFVDTSTAFIVMQLLTLCGALLALSSSYFVYFKKHFKPAGYYLVAWSVLLIGAILFIMKDYGIIPYNNFTSYLLQISSAIEVMLLSFALADKINFFKKENEIAQAQALNASLENQKLIKEQNIVLEKRVKERTEELQNTNSTLNITLSNLKNTQSQLVDAEKMAALGQLTAGIAHEINNPINFVTSNIKPLELDINDLREIIQKYEQLDFDKEIRPQIEEIESFKQQIDLAFVNNEISSLLSGISEGAKRTAEIIRSLRNFSRLDESDMKPIDLNEGLDSTIVLVRSNIPSNITVIKDFGNLPKVECQPGKINQVFMNLISNAIQAIKSKEVQAEEEFLTIKSWYIDQQVKISIKDSGIGMSDEVKHRIFEPFFTTKEVGEGTGLGLSIVFSIIENHKGNIEVISKPNEGTEFIITLNTNL